LPSVIRISLFSLSPYTSCMHACRPLLLFSHPHMPLISLLFLPSPCPLLVVGSNDGVVRWR
jgi:hypothetical protein